MTNYIKMLPTPICIVGLGKSGEAALRLLLLAGVARQDIITFDGKAAADFNSGAELMSSRHPKTLVVSPGVPLATDWILFAKKSGCTIISEINLACSVLNHERIIGFTGSLGKSTTVAALGFAALNEDPNAFVGGNLGTPMATYAADVLEGRVRAKWLILELSSYQLENCDSLVCDYSAITYLTPNHMERYGSLEDYYLTKWSLFHRTKITGFINAQGGDLLSWSHNRSAAIPVAVVNPSDASLHEFELEKALLIGKHNQQNLALAASIAIAAGWKKSAIHSLKDFAGLAHRLENLGVIDGIRYINDSKATAIDSVITAVKATLEDSSNHRTHVLLGGRDKNLPWQDLKNLATESSLAFYFFGEAKEIAQTKSQLPGKTYANLREAILACKQSARPGETILLSPGGTSLDEFKSFEDRGDFFKKTVNQKS